VLVLIGIFIAGNVVFHIEVYLTGSADYGVRIGIGAMIMLISLVGGRIVPSFTRNWLARRDASRQAPGRLPIPFSRFDVITIAIGFIALALWVALPENRITGAALIVAAILHAVRLVRWAGDRTLSDRLVLVLHVGYAFVPFGFACVGLSILEPVAVPPSAGIHAWTAGAIGMMTLAVMTRASLGHTGQELVASRGTQVIYALAFVAATLRVIAAFDGSMPLTELAALAWIAAFGGFVLLYGPLLARAKPIWSGRA
jgi:uncharacterized protein involved in response to NO